MVTTRHYTETGQREGEGTRPTTWYERLTMVAVVVVVVRYSRGKW
jgi:hypothetical protein